ncbi:MAG: phytanoyl-CoA dioxygenase family protein [Pseudomonadota bacterium]
MELSTTQHNARSLDAHAFERDGYVVIRGAADVKRCDQMRLMAEHHLVQQLAPVEFESSVGYPGGPQSPGDEGGDTVRRLLHAVARDPVLLDWATSPVVSDLVTTLLGEDAMLSQSHHNCVMTKQPGYSSVTRWHQDNRYWHFDREHLVSAWLALGDEGIDNGCLRVIPGSHNLEMLSGRFDADLFLRTDLAENKSLIKQAQTIELNRGDLLLFHSRLFHAASRNRTDQVKYSVVFTYHGVSNTPIERTRSARFPSIALAPKATRVSP